MKSKSFIPAIKTKSQSRYRTNRASKALLNLHLRGSSKSLVKIVRNQKSIEERTESSIQQKTEALTKIYTGESKKEESDNHQQDNI